MKALKLWRGATFDGLGILFLGWLYGVSIVNFDWVAWVLIVLGGIFCCFLWLLTTREYLTPSNPAEPKLVQKHLFSLFWFY